MPTWPLKLVLLVTVFSVGALAQSNPQGITRKEILAASRKATDFMMNSVANRGGFLWHYSADLSEQWGEVPARKSQIWVQPPSTPTVGEMLLEAHRVTGDLQYLKYAEQVAAALIWGQHPSGGWHYFIDFDPSGIRKFYEEVASQCRGWEEFYHYYGNATFDDDTTAAPTRFLLRIYAKTLDPKYRGPLFQALDFVLQSQYANGGWPQRYPLRYDFPNEEHPDYTALPTFNDDVIPNNIFLLLEAFEKLGNEEYKKAAYRGMDFYILSQIPSPQAGWAQQYDLNMKPASARSYEPAALCSSQTVENIRELQTFYLITGDRRYLRPIPGAIEWLEKSVVTTDPANRFTHAIYYELGSNKPLYIHHSHQEGNAKKILRFWLDYQQIVDSTYGRLPRIDILAMRREFDRLSALSADEVTIRYHNDKESKRSVAKIDAEQVNKLIAAMDPRGAWLTDIEFIDTSDYVHNPPRKFRGIDTRTFVSNMDKLMNSLKQTEK